MHISDVLDASGSLTLSVTHQCLVVHNGLKLIFIILQ